LSVKLILFDIDGTLLDVGGSGRWAMTRAFEDVFAIADADPFTRQVRFDGLTDPGILLEIASNASVSPVELAARADELRRSFLGHLESRLAVTPTKRVLPGVVDLLDRLAGVSMAQVGLLTGNVQPGARLKLASVGLGDYFDLGGFGEDAADRAGVGRVAVQRFEAKLKRSIDPDDVIAVGDSLEDVRAARANGFKSLAVGTGWAGHDAIRALEPDLFVEDLTDHGAVMQFIFGTRG
jgi:phosphoglycolate phosphatase-like HAD superfamily hydrolase